MSRSNRPELSDGTIRLRAPEHRDIDARFKLGNTPEIHHMFGAELNAVPVMTKALAERWYETQLVEPLAWVIEHRGKMIGALRLHSLRPWDASADVAIGILAPKKLGKGLGTRALHLLAATPLARWRCTASLPVCSTSTNALRPVSPKSALPPKGARGSRLFWGANGTTTCCSG